MNRYTSHDGENYPSSERRNWTLVISGACKPGISPADDRPRANCRRMQFAHRVGKPVEGPPGARLSVAARLSVRDDRAARLPASAPKHRRTPHCRARARVQTRTHTYVRRYVAVGRARTSVRARRIAPARGWHPGEFSCYVRGTSGEEKDEGEKGRRDDSLEERRETRLGTHASRDVDAAPRLYDGAYSHTRKTHRHTHDIREQTARYYAQSVGRRLGPDDTPRRYAIAFTH